MQNRLLRWAFWCSGAVLALGLAYLAAMFIAFRVTPAEQASVGIIGGADGPTAVFVTSRAAPGPLFCLLAAAAVFAGTGLALLIRRCGKR